MDEQELNTRRLAALSGMNPYDSTFAKSRNPKFTMPDEAPIKCKVCGGTLRPVEEFVMAYEKEFTESLGHKPTFPEKKWVCINDGFVYNPDFTNTGIVIDWAKALKQHYETKS